MLDLILLGVLVLFALKGWRAGFLSMLIGLAFLVIAGLVGSAFGSSFAEAIGITSTYLRPVLGFVIVFALVLAIGSWLRKFIRPKRGLLRGLDGVMGAVVGLLRGAFIVSILLVLLALFHQPSPTTRERSILYPVLLKTSTSVINVLRPYAHLPEHDTTV